MAAFLPHAAIVATARGQRAPLSRFARSLAPDLPRGVDHQRELGLLLVRGQHVPGRSGGEPALRGEREALERHVPGGLVDPPPQLILGLEDRRLGRDEAEHDHRARPDEPQRLRIAWLRQQSRSCRKLPAPYNPPGGNERMADWRDREVLIVGGGIGGLAAALALARQGIALSGIIEQAPEFKEIGAGIQLGPNVFWMFEILGLIEPISALAVFPNNLIMMDSITGEEVTRISLGGPFRKKFHYSYALIHRADLHKVLLKACRKSDRVRLDVGEKVVKVDETSDGVAWALVAEQAVLEI